MYALVDRHKSLAKIRENFVLSRNQYSKDPQPRQDYRMFVAGLAVLVCLAVPVRLSSNSFGDQTQCENCIMTKDDLARLFSGPKMAGFSQFSEKGIVEKTPSPQSQDSTFVSDDVAANETELPSGGGSYDIVLMNDVARIDEKTVRRLGFGLSSTEWSSLFFEVLDCPDAEPYVVDSDIDVWTENRRISFQSAIPQYPLLARMWDPFKNIWYSQAEISALKRECQAVSQTHSNTRLSASALQKIEAACDEALNNGLGLFLVAD
jgi:hypothetical protein